MFGLPLAFAAPFALAALVGLVALYWLLRVTPPRPREQRFPPLRLLLALNPREQTPAKTPWPLLALRLATAAAVVLAMAGPIWNAVKSAGGSKGALLVILDDGWGAAPSWERRIAAAKEAARQATSEGRLAALLPISQGAADLSPLDASTFDDRLAALKPAPWAPDRAGALQAADRFLHDDAAAEILWIADGLELGGASDFAARLKAVAGDRKLVVALDAETPAAVSGLDSLSGALAVTLTRADARGRAAGVLKAYDSQGREIGEQAFAFGTALTTQVKFELPVELRNEIARLAVSAEPAAGATWLVDERWRRRRVALVSGASSDLAEPLLSPVYYVKRALQPFAEIREPKVGAANPIGALLEEKPSALVLADMSVPPGPIHDAVADFVEAGGVLIRFAGPRLAAGDDDLIPVALRKGGRTLGGALSWETPKQLSPFEASSPFAGLTAPEEVRVSRQVLAEPDPGLTDKTWARLADGTPLVTAVRRGKGLIALFHVTGDTTWSNLPISGLFVEMLRRIVARANAAPGGAQANGAAALPPYRTLDGFGALGPPPATAEPIPASFDGAPGPNHPPGFYGAPEALTAINALQAGETLQPANYAGLALRGDGLEATPPLDLKPWLLLLALIGFLADTLASLWLSGPRPFARGAVAALAAIALICGLANLRPARAEPLSDQTAALQPRLAYVVSGDADVDETTRLGLVRLGEALAQRTSASLGDPQAVDPAHDELAFYPLIYWPIVAGLPQPPSQAVARITAYMKNGGTVIFDTRDALEARPGAPATPEAQWLRKLLAGVDVPELEPVPHDHVVTKTFYLLDGFVGRTDMGQTWIEALPPPDPSDRATRPARAGDSVSPIIIASNDLAGAWAADERGQPLHPLTPGGARQRELALRGGVNLVMYALTGNYKADQVHAKDLLERLSH
jgi:hypothetical protein